MPRSNAEIIASMRAQRGKELFAVQKLARELKTKKIPFIIYVRYPYEGTNYLGTELMDGPSWAMLFHSLREEAGIGDLLEQALFVSSTPPDDDCQMVKDFPEKK